MPSYKKIVRAFFEKNGYNGRAETNEGDLIGPAPIRVESQNDLWGMSAGSGQSVQNQRNLMRTHDSESRRLFDMQVWNKSGDKNNLETGQKCDRKKLKT